MFHQEFVRHFHVMLPEDLQARQEDIRHYLSQVDLAPDGFQVGRTMVWLHLSAFDECSESIMVVEFNLSESGIQMTTIHTCSMTHYPILLGTFLGDVLNALCVCVWVRCSCVRWHARGCRICSIRRCCGGPWIFSAVSEPCGRGRVLSGWNTPPASYR